jgi:hypothetical protein
MVTDSTNSENNDGKVEIFCRYITRKGVKIYPKNAKFFRFWVDPNKRKS